jgi:hypothetical protein
MTAQSATLHSFCTLMETARTEENCTLIKNYIYTTQEHALGHVYLVYIRMQRFDCFWAITNTVEKPAEIQTSVRQASPLVECLTPDSVDTNFIFWLDRLGGLTKGGKTHGVRAFTRGDPD